VNGGGHISIRVVLEAALGGNAFKITDHPVDVWPSLLSGQPGKGGERPAHLLIQNRAVLGPQQAAMSGLLRLRLLAQCQP